MWKIFLFAYNHIMWETKDDSKEKLIKTFQGDGWSKVTVIFEDTRKEVMK
jgi:hypothetical protein